MKRHVVNIIVVLTITLFSVVLSLPLFEKGFYKVHDDQQVARLFLYDQALKSRQFPVRWVDELGFGFGYPLFNFYPPLTYMVGELFHLSGFGFISSVKLAFFSGILFSAFTMYIFVKELWGRLPALVSTIFYILAPYRALDMYVRGALAESFSFIWLPAILWGFYKLFKSNSDKYMILSAIFLAFLMLTHNLIFLPFLLILPIYLFFLLFKSEYKRIFFKKVIISGFIAVALTAFFWAPALLEKQFTIVDDLLLVNLANYKIHFVYPQQLWNWAWGFGGSAQGLADGISFKIGKLHLVVSSLALILSITNIIKGKRTNLPTTSSLFPLIIFILLFFSAFMTTQYSKFIWDFLTPLHYLQFPWRFLTFAVLFSSILAGGFIYLLRFSIFKIVTSVVLITLLFIPNLKLFKPQEYRPYLTDKIATSEDIINWDISSTSFEYLPKGVDLQISKLGNNTVNITKDDIPGLPIEIINGSVDVNDLIVTPHKITFTANSDKSAQIQANTFSFPGWKVKINDNFVPIHDSNRLKLIRFNLEQGLNKVEIKFYNTQIRVLANLISFSTIIFLFLIYIRKWLIRENS